MLKDISDLLLLAQLLMSPLSFMKHAGPGVDNEKLTPDYIQTRPFGNGMLLRVWGGVNVCKSGSLTACFRIMRCWPDLK